MSEFIVAPVNASVQCIQTNYTGQYTVCITGNQVYSSQDYGQTNGGGIWYSSDYGVLFH